ncbi:class I SAM-dependent methyltransferase [Trichlorobacter lovleyi]|uniref:class I SAM-dependent methyltransferase n=1 Tax=Trichlorobacter lovleyi TaxID=313985 RepID=UPI00223F7B6D|nr:class I SAM-dependent methyltransferase [Trichlorobacter lovleyi]QOX80351.1 class I SAM-dependent methyltransferase [Trichlorobacter lovleyi]
MIDGLSKNVFSQGKPSSSTVARDEETLTAAEVIGHLALMVQRLPPEEIENFYVALAPAVATMAKTGKGTDACLEHGCLPMPVHFYSPLPDIRDLQERGVYQRTSNLSGIDWDLKRQSELLLYLGRRFGHECDWSPKPAGNNDAFYTENGCFSFGCAAALHCILRFFQPQRIVEIGSGNSSQIINAAVLQNMKEFGRQCDYTIVDPYPDDAHIGKLQCVSNLLKQRVETLPVSFFSHLRDGDVLFIDSGHVVKTGGDVNYLILEVLPRLAPGVIIHFHDIPMPYEYAEVYHTNPSFRMFWTESYLLQAFLAFNNEFEILVSMAAVTSEMPEILGAAFPLYDPACHLSGSQSIWLRRQKT